MDARIFARQQVNICLHLQLATSRATSRLGGEGAMHSIQPAALIETKCWECVKLSPETDNA